LYSKAYIFDIWTAKVQKKKNIEKKEKKYFRISKKIHTFAINQK